MTPSKESLDRARDWLTRQDQVNLALYAYAHTENGAVNSLALELDRVRLEGGIQALDSIGDYEPNMPDNRDDALLELRTQLAALNQPAGEKEG